MAVSLEDLHGREGRRRGGKGNWVSSVRSAQLRLSPCRLSHHGLQADGLVARAPPKARAAARGADAPHTAARSRSAPPHHRRISGRTLAERGRAASRAAAGGRRRGGGLVAARRRGGAGGGGAPDG